MELAHDALFSNLEITKKLIHNGKTVLDLEKSTLYIDSIITSNIEGRDFEGIREIRGSVNTLTNDLSIDAPSIITFEDKTEILKLKGDRNFQQKTSLAIGGELNESIGEHSSTLGGRYNESSGDSSTTIGGTENKASGECSVAMGKNSSCNHDNSFIFNSADLELETTLDKQFMIGSENGLMFKLPTSSSIQTHHIPEGFACWCWDPLIKTTILKTKQNGTTYKSLIPTNTDELKIDIKENQNGIQTFLFNPDLN